MYGAPSLLDLKRKMAERGINVDHSAIRRWVVHFSRSLLKPLNQRNRAVAGKWHADEIYI